MSFGGPPEVEALLPRLLILVQLVVEERLNYEVALILVREAVLHLSGIDLSRWVHHRGDLLTRQTVRLRLQFELELAEV